MEKLSGLILDTYDDREGSILRQAFPSLSDVPESVKVAMRLEHEQLAVLPDDVFALILHDGDVHMRKFACVDEGNTRMHIEYFLKTAHKLPVEAQKVAAENLCIAAGWYGIEPPVVLQKLAIGVMTALNVGGAALAVPGTVEASKKNLSIAHQSQGMVNPYVTRGAYEG